MVLNMKFLCCFAALVCLVQVCSGQGGITRELVGVLARQDDKLDQVIEKADAVLEKIKVIEEKVDKIASSEGAEGPSMPEFCFGSSHVCSMPNYFSGRSSLEACRTKCAKEARCKSFDHHGGNCHIMPAVCPDDKLRTPRSDSYYYVKPMMVPDFVSRVTSAMMSGGAAAASQDLCKVLNDDFQSFSSA